MKKIINTILFVIISSWTLSGQSTSGLSLSTSISMGDLISGESYPRIVRSFVTSKFQVEYSLVNWKHTIFRMGAGYQVMKETKSSFGYIIFPITFQRFIKSNKNGFNTSLVLSPSFTSGNRPEFYNTTIVKFNLELAVRAGTTFFLGKHKFIFEIELANPLSSIEKHGILKYINYGLRLSYYI